MNKLLKKIVDNGTKKLGFLTWHSHIRKGLSSTCRVGRNARGDGIHRGQLMLKSLHETTQRDNGIRGKL